MEQNHMTGELRSLIGQSLPDFTLSAYHKDKEKTLDFKDYLGHWLVLFFYPGDFTFVCPTELDELADLYPEFKKLDAELMSVSTDSVYAHKSWHDESPTVRKIEFPMLSDQTGKLCRALEVYSYEQGYAYRGSFVIDPEGVIRAYEVHDNNIGRSGTELLRKLQAAIFVREHPEQACPAQWRPGGKTLKPGMDIVGKI